MHGQIRQPVHNTSMLLLPARLLMLANLAAVALPASSHAQLATPREMECHSEATRRYIDDFRRVGRAREEAPLTAVAFVNDRSRYDAYYAECLGRWNTIKIR
jgi:hypothetical protein